MRKIDAGLVAVSNHLGVLRNAIDTQTIADVVEKCVAGMHQTFVQSDGPMLAPAFEEAAIKSTAAGATNVEIVVNNAALQARQGHDGLERGSRRLLRLNGPVQKRMIGIV